ncbi:hypothetical protein N8199_03015 [Emcibacteraceae bacterium]|jgi:hypothetical protein|nr:hypothetical protein [Emcibacteraceae bacterium]MDC1428846.1 hypothetical protein [Emcibacteraceae bacterium]|tara:strand:+ start:226 stop:366 length:141 start_codon:yes stop_codon:yes gene_type:complete
MTQNNQNSKSNNNKDKTERLSEALRDNLKRRKAQVRKATKNESKED